MLELVFQYTHKNNYQSYDIPFWFEAHCTNHEWLVQQKKDSAKADAIYCKAYRSKKITA